MTEPNCAVHAQRLSEIDHRLDRIESDMDTLMSEQSKRTTELALAVQTIELLRSAIARLEVHIAKIVSDRWLIIAGMLANGAIGLGVIGAMFWVLERAIP